MPAIRAMRWGVILALLLLVVIALFVIKTYEHPSAAQEGLTLYGNVDIREVQLAFNDEGRIQNLSALEGQAVRQGEVLGTLDDRRYRLAVDRAHALVQEADAHLNSLLAGSRHEDIAKLKAEVASSKSTLQLRKSTYDRIVRLARQKASPPQDLDTARAAYQAATAQLQALQASLNLALAGPRTETISAARATLNAAMAGEALAQQQLTDTRLLAPADGIIRTRILEPGDMASPQQPVYALALTRPLWVRAYVDEPNLGQVHPGQTAWVSSDSFPGKRFKAWVGYISPTAEFTPKTVETPQLRTSLVYQVRVFVCNPDNQLRLGMPTTVHILPGAPSVSSHGDPCQQSAKP
ncbi:efflux RND transporter periplasmic adaptor subunit [Acidihalobacter yilgarnensis]|nr:efflux RND transporter periplasmic adaptor subunit [Acidihalobacter yilgarnensis]